MKIAHIYACNAKKNSGDFMIGISTKKYCIDVLHLFTENDIVNDIDCRVETKGEVLNTYDLIIVGGGGLLLPDSAPNKNSFWQWNIKTEEMKKISKPIYVISIGYNTFNGQTMLMPDMKTNKEDLSILPKLQESLTTLIEKSVHFSMRHNNDIENLNTLLGKIYNKIIFEPCPTIWYATEYMKKNLRNPNEKYITIEIKDDREWRRYYKITKEKFYIQLLEFILFCQEKKLPVAFLSHDGSSNFFTFLKSKKIQIPFFDNSVANEKEIIENYSKISLLLCTAGHSQMIAYGLGIPIISLITHAKLQNFCDDFKLDNYINVNEEIVFFEKLRGMIP
jgi:hypothetical protein